MVFRSRWRSAVAGAADSKVESRYLHPVNSLAVFDVVGHDGRSYRRGRRPVTLPPPSFEPALAIVTRLAPRGRLLLDTIVELNQCWYQLREVPRSITGQSHLWRVISEATEEVVTTEVAKEEAIETARRLIKDASQILGGLIAVMPAERNRTPGDGTLPNYLASEIAVLNRKPSVDPTRPLDLWLDPNASSLVTNSTVLVGHKPSGTGYGYLMDRHTETVIPMLEAGIALHALPRFSHFNNDPMTPNFEVTLSV